MVILVRTDKENCTEDELIDCENETRWACDGSGDVSSKEAIFNDKEQRASERVSDDCQKIRR